MNEYLLIYKGGDPDFHQKNPEVICAIMERWGAWFKKLEAEDKLVNGGAPLHFAGKRISKEFHQAGGNPLEESRAKNWK